MWRISVFGLVVSCALTTFAAGAVAEPIRWSDGTWDEAGAPKGALLTDNPGWWGRSVFTGVTYVYEDGAKPTSPGDKSGRRLIDASMLGDWNSTVGKSGNARIVAVFDFKRPCVFSEVDLFSRGTGLRGAVETGDDGTNWTAVCSFELASRMCRVNLDGAKGRFMRLSVKANKGVTYLDEVLVWGEGNVSPKYPEAFSPIDPGSALQFTERRDGGIIIWPLASPTLEKCKVQGEKWKEGGAGAVPAADDAKAVAIILARNETEVRYFAVANASDNAATVSLAPPDFGNTAISAELLIGGVVRMVRPAPKEKLTEKQIIDLLITDEAKLYEKRSQRLDVLPFFRDSAIPSPNFARRYLVNPDQVVGFPSAVPLAPGEGCVVMLRVMSKGVVPGVRKGVLRAGDEPSATIPIAVDVRDVTLPTPPLWIHAYNPFTSQFPFESERRIDADVRRVAELGASSCYGLPHPRSKPARLKALTPYTICARNGWCPGRIFGSVYHGKWEHFDSTNRAAVAESVRAVVREAEMLGLKPEEYCVFLPDEPGRGNAALVGEMASIVKEAEPTLQIYMNPCFWTRKGFPSEQSILESLKPYYNEVIDISCPIRNLVQPTNALTKELWTAKRRVNAQYIHPAARAGRSIAWSSFENGMNGFAYYCYYSPRGNPWDIRTWGSLDYRYQMVFPLENDVAVTPIYETMREAWEDYRLLVALQDAGKTELLAELLAEYESATNYADVENVPNRANFPKLRERALAAFVGKACK